MHLVRIHKLLADFKPAAVIVDPISNLVDGGTALEAQSMLLRLVDFLKANQVTAMFTHLTSGGRPWEGTEVGVSSLIDTWMLLRDIEAGGERNRGLYVLKSRGMKHSNQIREFLITPGGIELEDVYVGPGGVLTGSMRAAQEAREAAEAQLREQELQNKHRDLERRIDDLEGRRGMDLRAASDETRAVRLDGEELASEIGGVRCEPDGDVTAVAREVG
jgi:circadian clock protein KaiC